MTDNDFKGKNWLKKALKIELLVSEDFFGPLEMRRFFLSGKLKLVWTLTGILSATDLFLLQIDKADSLCYKWSQIKFQETDWLRVIKD